MARILFIDDDIFTLETYEKMVSFLGYEAILANSGEKALQLASQETIDLILLDRQLTDMNGFEILKQLRAREATLEIPITLVTASHNVFAERAIAEGAQDFQSKPLLTSDIQALIDKYTSQR